MELIYQPLGSKQEINASYQPVPETPPNPGGYHAPIASQPREHPRRRIFWHRIWHLLSLLWLVPIATLLYLNFSHHVIGASAWCPRGDCNAESNNEMTAFTRALQLDRQDHDLNGALQFVAKALEVWFMFVATSLVYDVGILFAKEGRGLPVGYLLSHLEFSDIRYIFSPLLWTSPWPHRNSVPEKRARMIKLYIFAVITALLTILANLMGPATAVLVLPTMQWVDTPHIMKVTFSDTGAAHRPTTEAGFWDCNVTQLLARNYSCTCDTHGPSLDEWAAQAISSVVQGENDDGEFIIGSSQEDALAFTFNASANDGMLIWVPNRQVLRNMSHEFLKTQGWLTKRNPPEYPEKTFNNSLQTILKRQGPSLGFQASCYAGNVTDLDLDETRWVRCYTGWSLGEGYGSYTKCLRLGTGFDDTDSSSQFYLMNSTADAPDPETGVGIYFADKAMYFNDTEDFGSGIKSCLTNETSASCDWDQVFDAQLPDELRNTSTNVGIISYQVPGLENPQGRVCCEHVTYLSFPTYNVDTSPVSNPQNLVKLTDIESPKDYGTPIVLSPDWYLAAWSVDRNTALDERRQIVQKFIEVLPGYYYNSTESYEFQLLHVYALGQALSMVNYYDTPAPADPDSKEAKLADEDKHIHPILRTWASIRVWAYGLSGRTSKLGVMVVILGSVCVLARFLLGLATGVQERSTVEVIAAAFEHRHQGEFEGLEGERHLAKVRYQIKEDEDGKQRFIPEKRTSRWSHANCV